MQASGGVMLHPPPNYLSDLKTYIKGIFMNLYQRNRHRLNAAIFLIFALNANAQADNSVDLYAGYNAAVDTQNSFFRIDNTSLYDLANLVFTATDATAGWSDTWTISGTVAANQSTANLYFSQAAEAFASNFANTYAYTGVEPGDISYELDGTLNDGTLSGQSIKLLFSGNGGINDVSFLGLDQYGNATYNTDSGLVASADVAAVPVPGAFYLFATGLTGLLVRRKKGFQCHYQAAL